MPDLSTRSHRGRARRLVLSPAERRRIDGLVLDAVGAGAERVVEIRESTGLDHKPVHLALQRLVRARRLAWRWDRYHVNKRYFLADHV